MSLGVLGQLETAPSHLLAAGASRAGRDRASNGDAFLCTSNLFLLCDGIGGGPEGALGAHLAIAAIERYLRQGGWLDRPDLPPAEAMETLRRSVRLAHTRVLAEADRLDLNHSTTTTVLVALILDQVAVIASVGNSRADRVSVRGSERLTADHTVAEELAAGGLIAAADIARHPLGNVLVRSLGGAKNAEPDVVIAPFAPGDRLLLRSDGVGLAWGDDQRCLLLAAEPRPVGALASELIARSGPDDATVVLIERVEPIVHSAIQTDGSQMLPPGTRAGSLSLDTHPDAE